MNKRLIPILITSISIAIIALITVQIYWIKSAITLKQDEFKRSLVCTKYKLIREILETRRGTMGAMRMSDFYLSEVLRMSEWVIQNTNSTHSQNMRAKRLIKRVMKFVNQTGHIQSVNDYIKQDEERAVLFKD